MKTCDGKSVELVVKATLDRIAAAGLLAAISPLLAGIAAAVKLEDGGSVFFVQERPGRNAKAFKCIKFRTMILGADRFIDEEGRPTRRRVTKVGTILRWTSLDELPQLFNVLVGDMSFVGPRPPLMSQLRRYTEEQMRRFRVKPGITGLAQVSGRNTLPWSKRIEYDNWYIDNYSLLLDLKILLRTFRVVAFREGIVVDRNPDQVDDLRAVSPVGRPNSSGDPNEPIAR